MSEIMATDLASSPDGMRIARAIEYLTDNFEMQPSLDDAAREAGLSSYHFQRMFTRFVGISPKKFVQHLTLNRAKESLAASASVLDAAYGAGLSGPGRLHDLFVTHESLTPGEWKSKGAGKDIVYGWHPSPFGDCLIVASERGVCGLAFELEDGRDATIDNLFRSLGEARRLQDDAATKRFADRAFDGGELNVVLRGTPFQLEVWEGLLRIPSGEV
ncbi:MAG: helix-turn-helix domain-containing protein, partial [Pseudomonadota bacterium]|nr:helix-turn-helix domain-containing protein [Pseudomonadota bacterium]